MAEHYDINYISGRKLNRTFIERLSHRPSPIVGTLRKCKSIQYIFIIYKFQYPKNNRKPVNIRKNTLLTGLYINFMFNSYTFLTYSIILVNLFGTHKIPPVIFHQDFFLPIQGYFSINLCGHNTVMPHQFLYIPNICSIIQKLGRKTMTEIVRR